MSQPTLARLLGVTEQTIHKWEVGKTSQVPTPAAGLIRVIYSDYLGEKSPIRTRLKKIADLENQIDNLVTFISRQQSWRESKLKAA